MTDTNQSGAPAAPAGDGPAPAAGAETPAGSFGSTRGSGLSRGRRPVSASAPAATAVKSDYKPTAVEVITHEREYKNPFASQDGASAPASEPANVEVPAAPAAADAEATNAADAPAAPASPPEPVAEKPEIQILPPAESARPAVRWESPSALSPRESHPGDRPDRGVGEGRPTFRADRRDDRSEPRPEGRDFRRNQPQRDQRPQFEQRPRPEQPFQADRAPQEAKPAAGGFFGWLKRLFGGSKPAEAPAGRESAGEPFQEGHRHRRRHRGGRGRGGEFQGYRGDRAPQGGEQEARGGDRGGDRQGGRRRRRHRGGFGRDRGDPRSEGHQGGGAI